MTPDELRALLGERVLLLDGGLGSLLMAVGLERGRAPEWWNLEHPDRVEAAHRGYVEAGSDLIHTNTFGASPPKLQAAGLGGRCREINAAAVALARKACGASTLVAGDVGPTGLLLPPVGHGNGRGDSRTRSASRPRRWPAAGVDLISIETMYDLREALAAVEAARRDRAGGAGLDDVRGAQARLLHDHGRPARRLPRRARRGRRRRGRLQLQRHLVGDGRDGGGGAPLRERAARRPAQRRAAPRHAEGDGLRRLARGVRP